MSNSEKNNLKHTIMQVCFSLDDCKLFLDTHPNCPEALDYYDKLQKQRFSLVNEYNSKYGAIDAYSVNTDQGWDWNKGRMPWEGDD